MSLYSLKSKYRSGKEQLKKDIFSLRYVFIIVFVYCAATLFFFGTICPSVILCGYPCPGCGLTRGCMSILTGHFAAAAAYNVTSYLWLPALAWVAWMRYIADRRSIRWEPVFIIISVLTIIYYIYRMVYKFPENEPMVFFEENLVTKILNSSKMK